MSINPPTEGEYQDFERTLGFWTGGAARPALLKMYQAQRAAYLDRYPHAQTLPDHYPAPAEARQVMTVSELESALQSAYYNTQPLCQRSLLTDSDADALDELLEYAYRVEEATLRLARQGQPPLFA